jgi:hypothetical protein
MTEPWEYDQNSIEDLMREISNLDKPNVFNISLYKKDWSTNFEVTATLRADGRSFSVEHVSPVIALQELKKVLASLYCPACHQLKPADEKES